jgi:hypothetical protein
VVACAGVTVSAVATAIGIEINDGHIHAEGDLDFGEHSAFQRKFPLASDLYVFTLI